MTKFPYMPLYTGDWRKDPALTLCTPATRGVWIDLLCAMHDFDRSGELRGTLDELARLARCSTVELAQALTDLQNKRAAEITERNGSYIVRNRRMYAEYLARKSNAERQMRYRHGARDGPSNGEKTPPSDIDIESESDTSKLVSAANKRECGALGDLFAQFWEAFPRGRKKSKGAAEQAWMRAVIKCDPETIIAAAIEYAQSDEGRGEYVKMPSTWLNQECWTDDREAWSKPNGRYKHTKNTGTQPRASGRGDL